MTCFISNKFHNPFQQYLSNFPLFNLNYLENKVVNSTSKSGVSQQFIVINYLQVV
jgi:hypothetical protein